VSEHFYRMYRARMLRRAQEEIASKGPPEAPWQKFPEIPNSVSIGWRMGTSEAYLSFTFYPWWWSLSDAQKLAYLDETNAPADWRERLQPRPRE
jgi:hypothetical protein